MQTEYRELRDGLSLMQRKQAQNRLDRPRIVARAVTRGIFTYDVRYLPKRDLVLAATTFGVEAFSGKTLAKIFTLDLNHTVASIAVTPDESIMALGLWGGKTIQVFSLETRKLLKAFNGYETGRVEAVGISSDGRYVAATAYEVSYAEPPNNTTRVWDWRAERLVFEARDKVKGQSNANSWIAFNPANATLYESCGNAGQPPKTALIAYSAKTWLEMRRVSPQVGLKGNVEPDPRIKEGWRFGMFSLSPDGQRLAIHLSGLWAIIVLDSKTLKYVQILQPDLEGDVEALAFSTDSHFLASSDRTICVWDVNTGKLLARLNRGRIQSGAIAGIAFDRDATHLFAGGTGTVYKWKWR